VQIGQHSYTLDNFQRGISKLMTVEATMAEKTAEREKQQAALSSVLAAIGLTAFKIVVGIMTGSLGILSEAAHSGLDLVAALVTFFAVRVSDKPADEQHRYGHGKVENFSALIETLLLLVTAPGLSMKRPNGCFSKTLRLRRQSGLFW
jgi:divalent metal cation (Fe/Co/Zn/Cd) transporter